MIRLLATALTLTTLGAAPPPPPRVPSPKPIALPEQFSPIPAHCKALSVAAAEGSAPVRKLGDLPMGIAFQAVYRTGPDGCPDPLLVSDRVNGR